MRYIGNIRITQENASDWENLTQLYGFLSIDPGVRFNAPELSKVYGNIYVNTASFIANALQEVTGLITVQNGQLIANSLLTVMGLDIHEGGAAAVPKLVVVGGLAIASPERAEANLRKIAPLALAEGALNMMTVHKCETTHCLAGWACAVLPNGKWLEDKHSWQAVGFHFLGLEAGKLFYSDEEEVTQFLQQYMTEPSPYPRPPKPTLTFNELIAQLKLMRLTTAQWADLNYAVTLDDFSESLVTKSPDDIGDELLLQARRGDGMLQEADSEETPYKGDALSALEALGTKLQGDL